jgi:hypothetical protein
MQIHYVEGRQGHTSFKFLLISVATCLCLVEILQLVGSVEICTYVAYQDLSE